MDAVVTDPTEPGPRLRTAVVQHDIEWEDRSVNLAALDPVVSAVAVQGAQLVVLPEMFATGFSPRTDRIQEPPEGPTTMFMVEQARRHGIWILGSVCVKSERAALPANVAVLAAPDGSIHRYAKRHLFSYAGEHTRMLPGTHTLTVDVEGIRVSVFICYDLRFADDFWSLAAGTDLFVVVANWPGSRRDHWRSLLVARAIENQAFVIGCNRVGDGGGLEYSGDSLVVDPLGRLVADGAGAGETVLWADLDATVVSEVRNRYPFLADRL
ncbi:MAG: nitrilase-related carbon-nitrogen hydrolase [Microthrixaceae bacterium]|nr:carbon-nitrogen family hydrolase [Microthrixaceae bacterium]